MENPGNRVMYYLSGPEGTLHGGGGPEKAFVSEELMLILEDTDMVFKSFNL